MVSEIHFWVTDPDGCLTLVQTDGALLLEASFWDTAVGQAKPLGSDLGVAGKAKSQPEGPLLWALPLALAREIPSDCLRPQG